MSKPFVKWAGGKGQLLPELFKAIGELPSRGTYYEPFVGGGALFFAMRDTGWRGHAVINDLNIALAETYCVIRDTTGPLLATLNEMAREYAKDPEGCYYRLRSDSIGGRTYRASRFIALNKTCYNGLHRVNKAGDFNVPWGRREKVTICDEENLRACALDLTSTTITCEDFGSACRKAKEGDLVYLDPPYDPASATSNFTAYTKEGFGLEDQRRLAAMAWRLKKAGVHVILSSADTPTTRNLYSQHFDILRVEARRSINSNAKKRGAVGELIIT